MSSSMKINDLPFDLCEEIVKHIARLPRSAHVRPTLGNTEDIDEKIPPDLLPVAQSSPLLSTAVASVLGPRVRFLTRCVTATKLADWVRALAPHIKVVSFYEPMLARLAGGTSYHWDICPGNFKPRSLLREGITVLEAVSEPMIALRALDLTHVPVYWDDTPKGTLNSKLHSSLAIAFRHNAATLRELALPVSDVCARALEEVHLPKLEIAAFEFRAPEYLESEQAEEPWQCDIARMLHALQVSGGGGKGIRDLRLRNVLRNPLLGRDADGLSPEFLRGVKALDVVTLLAHWCDNKQADIATTCELFPELKCVRWNTHFTGEVMEHMVAKCPLLEEIHIDTHMTYLDIPGAMKVFGVRCELPRVFEGAGDKLRSIILHGVFSTETIHALGATNPNLGSLELDVNLCNVSALVPLLTSQCRKLHNLDLKFYENPMQGLAVPAMDGWQSLITAVCGASDALHVLKVADMEYTFADARDNDVLVEGICEILESLGDEVENVEFDIAVRITDYQVLFAAVRRVVETAIGWCGNLEKLSVTMETEEASHWNNEEEKIMERASLLRAQKRLWKSARRLHCLDLGRSIRKGGS